MRLEQLWTFWGTLGRAPYAVWGIALALAKIALESWLVPELRGRLPWIYWMPGRLFGPLEAHSQPSAELGLLALTALVFGGCGLVLTLQRLRSAGVSPWAAGLFFVPVVNVLLFVILCVVPPASPPAERARESAVARRPRRFREPWSSALLSVLVVAPASTALVFLCASELESYGWGLFLGIPFMLGLAATWIHGRDEPRTLRSSMIVTAAALGLTAVGLLAMAIEGLLCILMAVPLALPLALLGACVGHALQRGAAPRDTTPLLGGLALLVPVMTGIEERSAAPRDWIELSTPVEVDAPPALVWVSRESWVSAYPGGRRQPRGRGGRGDGRRGAMKPDGLPPLDPSLCAPPRPPRLRGFPFILGGARHHTNA